MTDGMMGDLSAEDFSYVQGIFDRLAAEWVRFGRPMPESVRRARGILDRAITCALSQSRQPDRGEVGELFEDNMIGTGEAAKLLGCDRKTVQRRAESLGGQLVAGRYVFDRNELDELGA